MPMHSNHFLCIPLDNDVNSFSMVPKGNAIGIQPIPMGCNKGDDRIQSMSKGFEHFPRHLNNYCGPQWKLMPTQFQWCPKGIPLGFNQAQMVPTIPHGSQSMPVVPIGKCFPNQSPLGPKGMSFECQSIPREFDQSQWRPINS